MLNNENYMSEVGTRQFQTFPLCSILLPNVGCSGILNFIWLWILIRRTKPSGCHTVALELHWHPNATVWLSRELESSATQLWEPQITDYYWSTCGVLCRDLCRFCVLI